MIKKLLVSMILFSAAIGFVAVSPPPQASAAAAGCYRGSGTADRTTYTETPCPSEDITSQTENGSCFIIVGSGAQEIACNSFTAGGVVNDNSSAPTNTGPCASGTFLGFPTWYKYLDTEASTDEVAAGQTCEVKMNGIGDLWLVAAAGLEIMLRIVALVALGFVIYGGVLYIVSQSQPEKTAQALKTVLNAIIGLVVSVIATALVSFIASRF